MAYLKIVHRHLPRGSGINRRTAHPGEPVARLGLKLYYVLHNLHEFHSNLVAVNFFRSLKIKIFFAPFCTRCLRLIVKVSFHNVLAENRTTVVDFVVSHVQKLTSLSKIVIKKPEVLQLS
jgi:hypothetical protein